MKYLLLALLALLAMDNNLWAQDRYQYRDGDPNGISKWYMGRQIAHVMSHYGIPWLERPEREKEEGSALLMKNMELKPGLVVADIGAGSGYYTARISKRVGSSRVYAVDVEPEMIAYLEKRAKTEKLGNIVPVKCTEQSAQLPAASVDIMLLVDVYHEFSYPYEMARSLLDALKPGGRLFLVEYRMEDPEVPIKTVHKMSEEQAVREMKAAGFRFERNIANLPWQHCLVFRRPE
jgi:FkbM family methyltransferase